MTAGEIGRLVGGELRGVPALPPAELAAVRIERLAKIQEAVGGDITFLANPKYSKYTATTGASAVLIAPAFVPLLESSRKQTPIVAIVVDDPYRAFLRLIDVFHPPVARLARGIHPSAVIDAGAKIGSDIAIGAHVVVGAGCVIGDGVTLYHNVVLHDQVTVGDRTLVYSNVTVREQCRIGRSVIIHSGTVIGSDGFGFAPAGEGSYEKIPQRGIVVIEDDVEIGANCAIDRATIGETRICRGVKLDNLIQVAHNVVIGEHTVIAAQSGISGSSRIGAQSMFGGQVGIAGHLVIAERTSIGAQSGVGKSITEAGKTWFGTPVDEMRAAYKTAAAVRQLPELLAEIRALTRRIEELEARLNNASS